MYQHALQKSGFKEHFECIASNTNRENNTEEKQRPKRKTVWFNLLYSVNVKTNIETKAIN